MNTYTWVVESMKVIPAAEGRTDIVCEVSWRVNATDGTVSASAFNTIYIPYHSESTWVEYADLTEAEVIAWVQEDMPAGQQAEILAGLDATIASQAAPTVVSLPLPW